jgi:hypothetical protein
MVARISDDGAKANCIWPLFGNFQQTMTIKIKAIKFILTQQYLLAKKT